MKQREYRIMALLAIDTAFFFLEIIVGYAVHSLALVADSFHMLNDVLSLVVALWAVRVAKSRGVDSKYTYGWQRAEILGALINGVFLVALCLSIFLEAIQRLVEPQVVTNPKLILIVGSAGLVSNIVGLVLFHEHGHSHGGHDHGHSHGPDEEEDIGPSLPETTVARLADERTSLLDAEGGIVNTASSDASASSAAFCTVQTTNGNGHAHGHTHGHSHHQRSGSTLSESHVNHFHAQPKGAQKPTKSLNMEGVFLHVLGDALGNIGVIATAIFIWKTDYSWRFYADPVISLVITAIIFSSAMPLCRKSSSILLQGVPQSINAYEVRADLESLPGVEDIHDLHIWILKEDLFIATLHVSVSLDEEGFMHLAEKIHTCLNGHGIQAITVQPEFIPRGSRHSSIHSGETSGPKCVMPGKSTGGLETEH